MRNEKRSDFYGQAEDLNDESACFRNSAGGGNPKRWNSAEEQLRRASAEGC